VITVQLPVGQVWSIAPRTKVPIDQTRISAKTSKKGLEKTASILVSRRRKYSPECSQQDERGCYGSKIRPLSYPLFHSVHRG